MQSVNTNTTPQSVEAVTKRLNDAIAALAGGKDMPIERARAIYDCASNIIDTVKVELQKSVTNREKQ